MYWALLSAPSICSKTIKRFVRNFSVDRLLYYCKHYDITGNAPILLLCYHDDVMSLRFLFICFFFLYFPLSLALPHFRHSYPWSIAL
jgi:hypothetical protein